MRDLFGTVLVPTAVQNELREGATRNLPIPDVAGLSWTEVRSPLHLDQLPTNPRLDRGEAEVIALGLESPENHLLLLDDLQGRRTAERLNLRVTGTLGVVLEAKRAGLLQRVAPTLELLRGTNMWISDRLIRMVLKQAGEA